MTDKRLYSIFLEYRGGTYISQTSSASPSEALTEWAASVPSEDLDAWNLKRPELQSVIGDGSLVPLGDRVNIWCLTGVDSEDEQLLVNLVATAQN